jgi:hypothetical protein
VRKTLSIALWLPAAQADEVRRAEAAQSRALTAVELPSGFQVSLFADLTRRKGSKVWVTDGSYVQVRTAHRAD